MLGRRRFATAGLSPIPTLCLCQTPSPTRHRQQVNLIARVRFRAFSDDRSHRKMGFWGKVGVASSIVLGSVLIARAVIVYPQAIAFDMKSTLSLNEVKWARMLNLISRNVTDTDKDFLLECANVVGVENLDNDRANLEAHCSTPWSPSPTERRCGLVIYPRSTEEISQIAKICHKYDIMMTPFSGGTSLEGAIATPYGGVTIDLKNMNRLVEIRPQDMDVTAEAGVDWQGMNEYLGNEFDLFFPPDPGPGACIGGMVATNCSGPNAYRYGTMKDWVVSLTVVLADGTIVKTRGDGRPRKTSAGYDLTRLFVGSSGTLGIVTEATLRLVPKPKNERVAVAVFPSTQRAVDTVVKLVNRGVPLAAIELLDEMNMDAINKAGFYDKREWELKPTIFFRFADQRPSVVEEQVELVRDLSQDTSNGERCLSFDVAETEAQAENIWSARKTALWSLLALRDNPETDGFLSSDVAVPISRLADMIEFTRDILERSRMKGSIIAHAGDGNFHAAILHKPEEKTRAEEVIAQIQQQGIIMEGTVAGEHGIGLSFRESLEREVGTETVDLMRRLKWAMDPKCLLNCDKVFKTIEGSGLSIRPRRRRRQKWG